jgi:MFS transporter, DHA1 family, tetracycline resistance protein
MGFLIGPGISGFLSQFSYQLPIFAAAGLSATSILATYFLLPNNVPPLDDAKAQRRLTLLDWRTYLEYFRRPELAPLLWQFFAFTFAFSMFISGFALFAERRYTWNGQPFGPKQVGYVYAFVGFLGIILQGGLIGRLVKRFGEAKLTWAGFFMAAVGFSMLAFTYSIPLLLLVSAIASIGTGALRPALTSLITQKASRSEQGAVLGLNQSLMSISAIVAPFIAGLLIDHRLLAAWALGAAVVSAIGLFL